MDDATRFQNERIRVNKSVDAGRMPESERDSTLAFGDHLRGKGEPTTAQTQMSNIRKAAEKASAVGMPPISEWDETDLNRFTTRLEDADFPEYHPADDPDDDAVYLLNQFSEDGGWAAGTRRNMKQHIKNYLEYLGEDWAEDIYIGAPEPGKVDASDLLRPDELWSMWSAIDNDRDRAIFAVYFCTIQRNAVGRAFRVGDVTIHEGGVEGVVRIPDDAPRRKRARGTKSLRWAVGPVADWLDDHPDPRPNAPLLCVNESRGNAVKGAKLEHANSVNKRLRKWAKAAGLERDRWDTQYGRKERTVKAHLLRYTSATRMAKSDEFNQSFVKKMGGWKQSSDQLSRYIKLTDEDVLAQWAEAYGFESAYDQIQPTYGTCKKCGAPTEDWLRECATCGHDVTEAAPQTAVSAVPKETRIREIVRETVSDMMGIGADADLTERSDAGAAALAVLAGNDDRPNPDNVADIDEIEESDWERDFEDFEDMTPTGGGDRDEPPQWIRDRADGDES